MFLYWTRIFVIVEVLYIIPIFDWLRCIIIHFYWNHIVHIHWHGLGLSKGLTRWDHPCWDRVMIIWARRDRPCNEEVIIIIWAYGYCPCENYLIYDSVLRLSAQTRGDRPCRYMDLASPHGSWTLDVFPRSIMYIRLSEYWVFWDISLHGIILHCISSHHSFLMIICFVRCLENT